MSKKFILSISTLLVIAVAAGVAIFFAKGYTFSPKEKKVVGTGILTISSEPDAASVYMDGHLTTATNATIPSLAPKTYSVKIVKEGFIPWEKTVTIKESLVTGLKVTLFPAIPTIYPLTFAGVQNPVLSSDGSKIVYFVPAGKKAGLWVWSMGKAEPLSFARNSEPHQITSNSTTDFSKATLQWSPDSKQVLAMVGNTGYLLEVDRLNADPRDVTAVLQATLKSWDEDTKAKDQVKMAVIKDLKIRKIASEAAVLRWSPDETKFMVGGKDSKDTVVSDMKLYDLGEDSQATAVREYTLPAAKAHLWLPDSRHVILVEDNAISLVDTDGTNKAVIFAGSFQNDFVFPWPDSSRLVMISTLPTPTASEPNFYGINLK